MFTHVISVGVHLRASARRSLEDNEISGSLPTSIGQLTALIALCVERSRVASGGTHPFHKASFQEPVDWADSIDDWTIDDARCLVRCRVHVLRSHRCIGALIP